METGDWQPPTFEASAPTMNDEISKFLGLRQHDFLRQTEFSNALLALDRARRRVDELRRELGGTARPHVCACNRCGDEWDTCHLLTSGDWGTEKESVAALDDHLERIGQFHVLKEVRGYYVTPRFDQRERSPRIDRLLLPMKSLVAAGWSYGPVGIECKRSRERIGPPISQLLDYSRAVWETSIGPLMLRWLFLWPLDHIGGTVESILAQNRLGNVYASRWGDFVFSSGQNLARFHGGSIQIGAGLNGSGANGRKAGSR